MISSQRHLFSLPEATHYLNCSYFSPLLKSQRAVMARVMDQADDPTRITMQESFFDEPDELRRLLGKLVNASPERIAIVPSVSYGIAIATHNVKLPRGCNVVAPESEFPSDVYGWINRCAEEGGEMRFVPRPVDAQRPAQAWSEGLLQAVDNQTAVINLTAVHWSDGTRFDLPALRQRAREVGAAFIVDGTQSVGALPFDFAALEPDLLVCAGYKWMMAPYGISFVVLGDRFLEGNPLEETWAGRKGSIEVGRTLEYALEYDEGARRHDMGQRAQLFLLPLMKDGVNQILKWTPEVIQEYTGMLVKHLAGLLEGSGFTIQLPGERSNHLFGITLPDPALLPTVQEELTRRNVSISYRGPILRVSPHLFNTPADVQALAEGLLAVAN